MDAIPDLSDVLDRTAGIFDDYVVFPTTAARDAVVLWVGHAHAIAGFDTTPRLSFLSAEMQSGKTRATEVAELVVPRALPAVNTTVPALFRSIGAADLPPTVILDEVDTIFGPKAPDGSEDLRGLINSGHRRGRPMLRCVGPNHEVAKFEVFAPVVLAGIGNLPATITDRSIIITMRRRSGGEAVRPFRQREAEAEAQPIIDWFESLTDTMVSRLDCWYPQLPGWLTDRPADCWEPLISIADLAGGDWPKRARDAARVLMAERSTDDTSIGVKLLAEVRDVMATDTVITTEDLLARLHALDESPWAEWGITPRWLASHLKPFGVTSKNVRIGAGQKKGYDREQFSDAWARYVPGGASQPSQASDQPLRDFGDVPGTDTSVPTSPVQLSDQRWDGKTDGTQLPVGVG